MPTDDILKSEVKSDTFGKVCRYIYGDEDYIGREGDLAGLLKTAKIADLQTALRYAIEIAEGVSHLHLHNIIHGDIKPGNVLVHRLGNHNRLVLGDLDDLVQMQQSATCSGDIGNIRGTPRYMSPEMLKKYLSLPMLDKVGRKTDVWSVGCVILELMDSATGNTKRRLYRAPKGILDIDEMNNSQYVAHIVDGYAPLTALSLPVQLAECISL
ncbi:mitogen-activated protein kinase kinase kinase 3-like [Paramacrobiotus metropolitanus]|uniref:mitogen-activated protein kinase kinase kinase 3-like n=1 Tax=Paramacrobiotus metropolitanus TaxID=2943436 RepID=UPI00244599C9|nr:mitogen-activated protein kinase kinase kinase 3-like [Paramacrobiotus metropolitanus]